MTNFENYYKATVIKTVQYWQNNRHINQGNSLEIDSCKYSQVIFNKATIQFNGERIVFSINGFWITKYPLTKG